MLRSAGRCIFRRTARNHYNKRSKKDSTSSSSTFDLLNKEMQRQSDIVGANKNALERRVLERNEMHDALVDVERRYDALATKDHCYIVQDTRKWLSKFHVYAPQSVSWMYSMDKLTRILKNAHDSHFDPFFRLQMLRYTSSRRKIQTVQYISKFVTVELQEGNLNSGTLPILVASFTPKNNRYCAEYAFDEKKDSVTWKSNSTNQISKPFDSNSYLQWAYEFDESVRKLMDDNGILYTPPQE